MLSIRNERESSKRAIYEPRGARQILIVLYVFFPVNVNTRYLSLVIKLYLHFSFSGVIRKRYVR